MRVNRMPSCGTQRCPLKTSCPRVPLLPQSVFCVTSFGCWRLHGLVEGRADVTSARLRELNRSARRFGSWLWRHVAWTCNRHLPERMAVRRSFVSTSAMLQSELLIYRVLFNAKENGTHSYRSPVKGLPLISFFPPLIYFVLGVE
jgi:hypothetical protein